MLRRLVAERAEIFVQVVLELIAAAALRAPQIIEPGDRDRIDDLCPEVPQFAERAAKDRVDLLVERRRVVRLMQDAEPRALQPFAAKGGSIVGVHAAATR